jgi:transcriptional regulator of acetoin/glycerol metabolism
MVAAFARERPIQLTPAAGCAVLRYDWPLNVRELHHALDVATALADGDAIDIADLPSALTGTRPISAATARPLVTADLLLERVLASLTRHCGNVSEVAREFGKERKQVQRWMGRFGIDARSFRKQ